MTTLLTFERKISYYVMEEIFMDIHSRLGKIGGELLSVPDIDTHQAMQQLLACRDEMDKMALIPHPHIREEK